MGIKTEARQIMREAGLPIVPGTEDPVKGIAEAKKVAAEVGYPIMLKALAGGGGKGMRLVRSEEEMETALRLSQSEACNSFTVCIVSFGLPKGMKQLIFFFILMFFY